MEEIRTFKRGGASVRAVMVEGEPMVLFRDLSALCGYAANTGSARYYCAEPPCPDAARVLICKLRNAARESGNSVRANALADALAVMDGAA